MYTRVLQNCLEDVVFQVIFLKLEKRVNSTALERGILMSGHRTEERDLLGLTQPHTQTPTGVFALDRCFHLLRAKQSPSFLPPFPPFRWNETNPTK